MRKILAGLGTLAVIVCLNMSFAGTAQAAPLNPAATVNQAIGSLATNVHCRAYRHCHRRCWWRRGVRRCARYCHRCG